MIARHTFAAVSSLVLTVCLFAPSVALACPVCFSAQNENNRVAFVVSTMFLTLLPLGMLTAGLWWAWRRLRQQDERVAEKAQALEPSASGTPLMVVRK